MKTIITGASGDYGRRVAQLLVEETSPNELILTTRTPEKLASFAERGVAVRYADFDKSDLLSKAFEGGDRMLMISTMQVGRRAAQHGAAIQAAKLAGVRHIVYTSFVGIDPKNPALVVPITDKPKIYLKTQDLPTPCLGTVNMPRPWLQLWRSGVRNKGNGCPVQGMEKSRSLPTMIVFSVQRPCSPATGMKTPFTTLPGPNFCRIVMWLQ
jgi:hypothetical protein